jgi:hypothetical protein
MTASAAATLPTSRTDDLNAIREQSYSGESLASYAGHHDFKRLTSTCWRSSIGELAAGQRSTSVLRAFTMFVLNVCWFGVQNKRPTPT